MDKLIGGLVWIFLKRTRTVENKKVGIYIDLFFVYLYVKALVIVPDFVDVRVEKKKLSTLAFFSFYTQYTFKVYTV